MENDLTRRRFLGRAIATGGVGAISLGLPKGVLAGENVGINYNTTEAAKFAEATKIGSNGYGIIHTTKNGKNFNMHTITSCKLPNLTTQNGVLVPSGLTKKLVEKGISKEMFGRHPPELQYFEVTVPTVYPEVGSDGIPQVSQDNMSVYVVVPKGIDFFQKRPNTGMEGKKVGVKDLEIYIKESAEKLEGYDNVIFDDFIQLKAVPTDYNIEGVKEFEDFSPLEGKAFNNTSLRREGYPNKKYMSHLVASIDKHRGLTAEFGLIMPATQYVQFTNGTMRNAELSKVQQGVKAAYAVVPDMGMKITDSGIISLNIGNSSKIK